ncbi:MAG: zinc ribbon domain-containing protein [Promethearchaeota archaeon]|jgi:predicted transposase YbfD/YdcC
MVLHFESFGNFNSGIPTFRALISKRARVTIQLTEAKLSFQSDIDKILYEVKLSEIQGYHINKRYRIPVIELLNSQGNVYTFFPRLIKDSSRSYSKSLTEDLFRKITRLYIKNNVPIIFETRGAFWEGSPPTLNWKLNLMKGIILLTENRITFKPLKQEYINQLKILNVKEIVEELKSSNTFIKLTTKDDKTFTLLPLKKRMKHLIRDKHKAEKLLELLNQVKMYKDSEQIRLTELEKERIEKIKSMVDVSNRIKLDMMRTALEMDEKTFTDKVFEWAKKFEFVIDGKYLIVNPDYINEFMLSLRINEMDNIDKIKCSYCENLVDIPAKICPYCGKDIKL